MCSVSRGSIVAPEDGQMCPEGLKPSCNLCANCAKSYHQPTRVSDLTKIDALPLVSILCATLFDDGVQQAQSMADHVFSDSLRLCAIFCNPDTIRNEFRQHRAV